MVREGQVGCETRRRDWLTRCLRGFWEPLCTLLIGVVRLVGHVSVGRLSSGLGLGIRVDRRRGRGTREEREGKGLAERREIGSSFFFDPIRSEWEYHPQSFRSSSLLSSTLVVDNGRLFVVRTNHCQQLRPSRFLCWYDHRRLSP